MSFWSSRVFDDDELKRMRSTNPVIPLFYGLPKLHKENIPLRPIVSFCGSATYKLAKELDKRLKPLTKKSSIMIKNNSDLLDKIQDLEISEDEELVSFDVKSLFTCIPLIEIMRSVSDAIDEDEDFLNNEKLSKRELMELLDLCLNSTFFGFRSRIYHQKKGTPMGSPISVVVSEIVLQSFEKSLFLLPIDHVKFFARYVDDVISIIKKRMLQDFFDLLNQKGQFLQFTLEEEQNGSLPFLDILIQRREGKLSTSVFRKKVCTNRLLDYESYHPSVHKKSVVRTLYNRAKKLCSSEENFREEKDVLKSIFKKNNYPPRKFVEWTSERQIEPESQPSEKFISAPYIKGVSEVASRVLKKGKIRLAHKPMNTLRRQLVNIKDKRRKEDCAGVVYSIPCNDCPLSYVGETGRQLGIRISEHQRDVRLKNNPRSNVLQHVRDTGHSMDFESTKILYYEQNSEKRLFLESWATNINTLNRAKDLNPAYAALKLI